MKKVLLFLFCAMGIALLVGSCSKSKFLPLNPNPTTIFSADPVHHTKDSVNVGDTLYFTATGVVTDTTQNIYVYLVSTYTASGAGGIVNYGTPTAPVKVVRTITGTANASGQYPWSATLMLPGATLVPHKTSLTVTGNYVYQLSLSSALGILAVTDAGIKIKTVYVK